METRAVCPRPPVSKPNFTVKTLRDAIPPHCFERSTARSSAHLIADIAALVALYWLATLIDLAPGGWRWILWPAFWAAAGCVGTGVWVIAHECGHQAFSPHSWVNDLVGFVLHSALLVPYFSWKHSHRRHHSNTGSVTGDEVFVPTKDEAAGTLQRHAWYRVGLLAVQSLAGWPLYLLFNTSGREYSRPANHFDPRSPIFAPRERPGVLLSDLGVAGVMYGLYCAGLAWGWAWLAKVWLLPYLVVNFWLVTITFLQHTHPNLPHYDEDDWDWLRGALATVDRSYGRLLDCVFHHIGDTHVAHHLFSCIPHYHAEEATAALVPLLGPYYNRDGRNVLQALWQEVALCHFVAKEEGGGGALWFATATRDIVVAATAAVAEGFDADKAAELAMVSRKG